MRDSPHGKERLEVTLDARELVSIALGLMVVLGLVFYLGVTVGKDLAPAAAVAEGTSLEALDARAEAPLEKELTFAEVLTEPAGKEASAAPAEAKKAQPEKAPEKAAEKKAAEPQVAAPGQGQRAPAADVAHRPEGSAAVAGEAAGKVYSVQIGSFPQRAEAEALQQRLRGRGLSPSIVEAEIADRGTYHRVRLGRFASREEAKRYQEDLHRETQLEGFVVEADG